MHEPQQPLHGERRALGPVQPYPTVPDAIDVTAGPQIDYVKLVRKNALLAILLMIVGGLGGILSVALTAPRYRASALLEVLPANAGVLKLQAAQDYGTSQDDLATESRILLSNTFLRQVVLRLQLEHASPTPVQSGFFSTLRKLLKVNLSDEIPVALGVEGLNTERVPKALAMSLQTVKADPVPLTHLIEISCESSNPQFAADFLNVLTDAYIEHNYQARMETVRSTTQWISGQLEEAKTKMTEAEAKLQDFTQKSGSTFITQGNALAGSKLQDLQVRLAAAQSELITKQALYEAVHKATPEALPNVIDDPSVRMYQTQITALRREEALLLTTLKPEHYKVKNIEAQIADLQESQQKELSAAVKRIDSQYETAKRNQELLRNTYVSVAQQIAGQTGKDNEYSTLKKSSDLARESYQALLLQANQASVVGSLPVNNIQAVDRAVAPEAPSKPKPLVNTGGGVAAGLALCCGIAFLREKMNPRVGSPKDARWMFNLPQLGVIPSVEESRNRRSLLPGLGRGRAAQLETGEAAISSGASLLSPTVTSANPLLAESFRMTLASLMRESAGLHRPQVILVTSPGPEEGKTTIASNLGIALAETGRRVLVIDADFRRPRAHRVFGVANTDGLVDRLNEEILVDEYATEKLGVKTSVANLLILPNGTQSQNITQALYSPRLRQLVHRLRREFDTILIDAPPMLPVADARVMAEMADGVVLVMRSGVTDKSIAMESLEQLRADRTIVLGTILNDWKPSKGQAKKNYYYSTFDSHDRT